MIFQSVKKSDRRKIQELIDFEKEHCPIFETLTVDDVISKLYSRAPRAKPKIVHERKK